MLTFQRLLLARKRAFWMLLLFNYSHGVVSNSISVHVWLNRRLVPIFAWLRIFVRSEVATRLLFLFQHLDQASHLLGRRLDAESVFAGWHAGDPVCCRLLERAAQAVAKATAAPAFRERLAAQGAEPMTGTPESLAALVKTESARFARLIRDAAIRAE